MEAFWPWHIAPHILQHVGSELIYSVDAGLIQQLRSYGWCNMRARCGQDVFFMTIQLWWGILRGRWLVFSHETSTLLWHSRPMIAHDVIHQNDLQNVRNRSISHKNGMRTTWKKLWFIKKIGESRQIFVTKWGLSRLYLNSYTIIKESTIFYHDHHHPTETVDQRRSGTQQQDQWHRGHLPSLLRKRAPNRHLVNTTN